MQLPEVTRDCSILLANATQENKQVLEASLRHVDERRGERSGNTANIEQIEKAQEEDRYLIRTYLIKDWKGMFEADETTGDFILDENDQPIPIPCTPENVRDFVEQIQGWLLTRIKQWAMDPENFIGKPAPLPDANALGKV